MAATRREVVADLTGGAPGILTAPRSWSQSRSCDSADATTDNRDDLVRGLSRLPEQQRKIVVLRYYADQSEAAVAEALGISVGTVKTAASRGLAALRSHAGAERLARAQEQVPVPVPTHATNPLPEGSLR